MKGPLADPWWAPTRGKVLTILALLVVAALGVSGARWAVTVAGRCGPGVERIGGECIGVTDGALSFTDRLADVTEKIRKENQWVDREDRPHISIAYLSSLPSGPHPSGSPDSLRHQLEGAYIAQRRANHTDGLRGDAPLVRLLLANAGNASEHWRPVVADLVGRTGAPDELRAVVGLGQSRATTRLAIAELARHHIPMVGTVLTADYLGTEPGQRRVDGFVRVAPTNTDEAKAAAAHLKPVAARALLIQDTDPDDLYAATLGAAFRAEYADAKHTILSPVEQFDSSLPGVAGTFAQLLPDLCQQKPDAVYFAGRGEDLQRFIEVLPQRTCLSTLHVTILTADDAATLPGALRAQLAASHHELEAGLRANVTVRYTALAHPDAWEHQREFFAAEPVDYLRGGCADCFGSVFRAESLDDGEAIMGHDALAVAVIAIRSTTRQTKQSTTVGEVVQQWNRLHGTSAIPGASGWISLDDDGRPMGKAVPIVQLEPGGLARFVTLSAASGRPFTPPP